MAAPPPSRPSPTPPPMVFTNHQPQHPKPEPPPPPDTPIDRLIRQRRRVMRGFDKEGREMIGPDLDLGGRAEIVGRQSWNTSYPTCDNVGNNVLSCYPTQGLTLVESDWFKFVWNLRQPQFIGAGTVDVYLFHADSDIMALEWPSLQNAAGQMGIQVDDMWWGDRGNAFDGTNVTFPYYFVVVPGGTQLTGGESRLATFLAIQTATPATLISASSVSVTSVATQSYLSTASLTSVQSVSSISATSVAALASVSSQSVESLLSFSSALPTLSALSVASPAVFSSLSTESVNSARSLSSLVSVSQSSIASRTANNTVAAGATPTGDLQGGSDNGGGTPAWAIAVPVVLGVLALVFLCALLYFAARYFRWRRVQVERRGSLGSQSPMMADMPGNPASKPPKPPSPVLGGAGGEMAAAAAAGAGAGVAASSLSRDTSDATTRPRPTTAGHNPDTSISTNPSDLSRAGSAASPFSGVDAAIMARAFREALNKPDFSLPVEEGSSGPSSQESGVPQVGDSPAVSKDGHTTGEGGIAHAVMPLAQEEGGRVGRVGEQSVRVQGPPSGEG